MSTAFFPEADGVHRSTPTVSGGSHCLCGVRQILVRLIFNVDWGLAFFAVCERPSEPVPLCLFANNLATPSSRPPNLDSLLPLPSSGSPLYLGCALLFGTSDEEVLVLAGVLKNLFVFAAFLCVGLGWRSVVAMKRSSVMLMSRPMPWSKMGEGRGDSLHS